MAYIITMKHRTLGRTGLKSCELALGGLSFLIVVAPLSNAASLEAISKSPEQYSDTAEMNKAQEVLHITFLSNNQAPEVVQPGKQAFDFPPSLVAPQHTPILGLELCAIAAMRCNHFNPLLLQSLVKWVTVISTISNQPLR
jgi:hypothetical protein